MKRVQLIQRSLFWRVLRCTAPSAPAIILSKPSAQDPSIGTGVTLGAAMTGAGLTKPFHKRMRTCTTTKACCCKPLPPASSTPSTSIWAAAMNTHTFSTHRFARLARHATLFLALCPAAGLSLAQGSRPIQGQADASAHAEQAALTPPVQPETPFIAMPAAPKHKAQALRMTGSACVGPATPKSAAKRSDDPCASVHVQPVPANATDALAMPAQGNP